MGCRHTNPTGGRARGSRMALTYRCACGRADAQITMFGEANHETARLARSTGSAKSESGRP
jgi:hypothetical protein